MTETAKNELRVLNKFHVI